MTYKIFIVLSVLISILFINTEKSYSEEIDLCIAQNDEYATVVNSKQDCLDDEVWMKIRGGEALQEKLKYTPLVKMSENVNCETEGYVRAVGFDTDNDGYLDQNEIAMTKTSCKLVESE